MHRSGHGLPLMLSHSPLHSLSPMLAIPHALLLSCALSPPCLTLAHLLSWSQSRVLGLMLLLSVLCAQPWSRSCTLALGLSHTLCLGLSLAPSVLVLVLPTRPRPCTRTCAHLILPLSPLISSPPLLHPSLGNPALPYPSSSLTLHPPFCIPYVVFFNVLYCTF